MFTSKCSKSSKKLTITDSLTQKRCIDYITQMPRRHLSTKFNRKFARVFALDRGKHYINCFRMY